MILTRVYPNELLHTQANGRHSITKPPLQTLPPSLERLYRPDAGRCWVSFDWSGVETWLIMARSRSRFLRRAFDEGLDIHTFTVGSVYQAAGLDFPRPPNEKNPHTSPECADWRERVKWEGKDDRRRAFCKSGRYEVYYSGGTASNAIVRAARMGLPQEAVKILPHVIMRDDPDYASWVRRIKLDVMRTKGRYYEMRSFMGRRRRIMHSEGFAAVREALNVPQADVADMANVTAIGIKRACPWLNWAWGKHDSQYWDCPVERADEALAEIEPIVEQEWNVFGYKISFPASYKVISGT